MSRAVFVEEVALIDCPFEDVARRLESQLSELLAAAADETAAAGKTRDLDGGLVLKVAPASWPEALAKTVVVRTGPVRRQTSSLLAALSWEPANAASLFPRLDADIEVAPCGTSETSLTLRGRYEPPAGPLGRQIDKLVLHRVAEATVRAFLENVADELDPTIQRPPRGVPRRPV
jgi:hypothetical protein